MNCDQKIADMMLRLLREDIERGRSTTEFTSEAEHVRNVLVRVYTRAERPERFDLPAYLDACVEVRDLAATRGMPYLAGKIDSAIERLRTVAA